MIKSNYPPSFVEMNPITDFGGHRLLVALLHWQYLKFPAVTSLGVFCPGLAERAENC